jgi:molecular chaperone GrpE
MTKEKIDKPEPDLPNIVIVEAEPVEEEPAVETVEPESLGLDLPEDPAEAMPVVLEALAEARMDADRYLDDLRRVAADFENYRKRTQREMAAMVERASERVVRQLLPVLDSFEGAMAMEAKSETEEKLLVGVRNTYELLLDVLAKEGLEPIEAWDEPFDPHIHEAVATAGDGEGTIRVTQELRRGYKLRGKVLRPALVVVAPEQTGSE